MIGHLDDERVVRPADHLRHAGSQLRKPQTGGGIGIEVHRVRVEIGADELPPDDPLVGHLARRGPGCPGAQLGGHLELRRRDGSVEARLVVLDAHDFAAVQLVALPVRDFDARDVAPVREDEIVGRVALDVVGVARADASGEPRLGIESNREVGASGAIVERRSARIDRGVFPDGTGSRLHLQDEARRAAQQLALGGRQAHG